MVDATQSVLTVGIPTLAVLIGILVNNSRLSDLRSHVESGFRAVDARFDNMDRQIDARFNHMDQLFQERLRRVEEVVDARLSRIEGELHIK